MTPSDSRPGRPTVMDSRPPLRQPAPRRVSQVPRSSVDARPPQSPRAARCCMCSLLPLGGRLHHLRKVGHPHWCNEAESGSLALGSRLRSRDVFEPRPGCIIARPDRSVSRRQLPFDAGPELHVERAIHMADTSQSAREMRVTRRNRRSRRRRDKAGQRRKTKSRCGLQDRASRGRGRNLFPNTSTRLVSGMLEFGDYCLGATPALRAASCSLCAG